MISVSYGALARAPIHAKSFSSALLSHAKKEAAAGGGVAIKVAGAAVAVDVRWRPL